MAVSQFGVKPKKVKSIDSYYQSMGGPASQYKLGYLPNALKAPPAFRPDSYYPGMGGPAAASPMGVPVPVMPAPKPPKAAPLSFSIDDDPTVKAAKDALPLLINNAQKTARGSIIARLLQYGDPNLSGVLDKGAASQMLKNLQMGKQLGSEALDLLSLDDATKQQIAAAYGAEGDEAVMRDVGPSGISTKAQFDRSVAQSWRQRLGGLTGRGAVRSGDLGFQSREQEIARDVGVQSLISSLLSGLGTDVAGVNTARQAGEKALQDAVNNARAMYVANPTTYAALLGLTEPTDPPPAPPTASAPPSRPAAQSSVQRALTPEQFGILQSVFGGRR